MMNLKITIKWYFLACDKSLQLADKGWALQLKCGYDFGERKKQIIASDIE